jgi:hypothetical protein
MFDRLSEVFKCPLNLALGFPDKAPADEDIRRRRIDLQGLRITLTA